MDISLTRCWRQILAFVTLIALLLPLGIPVAYAQVAPPRAPAPTKPGMSTKKKAVLLAGAALLYYLYRRHQANAPRTTTGQPTTVNGRTAQLYRSKNGGIYYRDTQGRPVWLTVPRQGIQVPAEEVQRYAPDYNRYRGPAPAAPSGYRTQPFSEFDSTLVNASYPAGPRGPR
jgi:hypothetical protein